MRPQSVQPRTLAGRGRRRRESAPVRGSAENAAQRSKTWPAMALRLNIADAALVLPLGARPVRCASMRPETPVACKRVQPFIEAHLAGGRVMMLDQRSRIVEQHLLRHP